MGPGVVGRMSYVAVALALAGPAGAWAMQSQPIVALLAFVLAEGSAAVVAMRGFNYATKFPNHAVMEGAEYVRFAESMKPSASDPKIITIDATAGANTSPPRAITATSDDGNGDG